MQLFPHQERGVELFVNNPFFANFGEPGTGKTAQVIIAAVRLAIRRVLIVCPSSLILNWAEEFEKWTDRFVVIPVLGDGKKRLKTIQDNVNRKEPFAMIINYEAVAARYDKTKPKRVRVNTNPITNALSGNWGLVACDEHHRAKNHQSATYYGLKQIGAKALRRWGLTGTPTPNNPLDIWAQIDWIKPGHLNQNFYAFRNQYADIYTGAGFPMIRKFTNQDHLKTLIDAISYRVTKDECLKLPPKIRVSIPIEMSAKTRKVYDQMLTDLVVEVAGNVVTAEIILTKLLRLQQITSGYIGDEDGNTHDVGTDKIDALKDLMEDIGDQHVVIMARFASDLPRIRKALGDRDVVEISGAITREDRQAAVTRFQEDNPCVCIATIQAGGVGLTLTKANVMIYYSRDFSLGNAIQSEDRIHRVGQKSDRVIYYDLLCKGTIDEYIKKVLEGKKVIADKLTGDDIRKIAMGGE